jgi:2-polyprenyl-3-methyl-5-hydroxy-6-metoxy-1,4-benzoquinol methylase
MTAQIDEAKMEAFAGHVLQVLNGASTAMLSGVAHQTGLFDVMATLPPSTYEEIATQAGLNERYVREILGGLVLGGFVEYDPSAGTYRLPPEHAALLTREAGPDNLAYFTQYYARLAEVEPRIVEATRSGGGVPPEDYPWFTELQSGETGPFFEAALVDVVLPFVPGITKRLQGGIKVLDVGTGSGQAVNVMARAFPQSTFVGIDVSQEAVDTARKQAADLGITNASFEVLDGRDIEPGAWDLITAFDVIHDLARPREVLAAIARGLRENGSFLMGDIAASSKLEENLEHPLGSTLHFFSTFYCMTTSLAQGGEALGTMWGEQKARELLAEAGFARVDPKQIEGDPMHAFYVADKS